MFKSILFDSLGKDHKISVPDCSFKSRDWTRSFSALTSIACPIGCPLISDAGVWHNSNTLPPNRTSFLKLRAKCLQYDIQPSNAISHSFTLLTSGTRWGAINATSSSPSEQSGPSSHPSWTTGRRVSFSVPGRAAKVVWQALIWPKLQRPPKSQTPFISLRRSQRSILYSVCQIRARTLGGSWSTPGSLIDLESARNVLSRCMYCSASSFIALLILRHLGKWMPLENGHKEIYWIISFSFDNLRWLCRRSYIWVLSGVDPKMADLCPRKKPWCWAAAGYVCGRPIKRAFRPLVEEQDILVISEWLEWFERLLGPIQASETPTKLNEGASPRRSRFNGGRKT